MNRKFKGLKLSLLTASVALFMVVGCKNESETKKADATPETQVESFASFEASTYRGPDGVYVVDGDIPVGSKEKLREFYEAYVVGSVEVERGQNPLIVHKSGGADSVWDAQRKKNLSYCVSNSFGSDKSKVVQEMAGAARAWEAVADVKFVYVSAQDGNCTAYNSQVLFDVNPAPSGSQYLARAFFPDSPRSQRNVLIADGAIKLPAGGEPSLVGVLRHELGHVLGFRHEHTRPESGATKCYEDRNWSELTTYDSSSVMHYPQCNGTNGSKLVLTAKDKDGTACLYGAAPGYTIGDHALRCKDPDPVDSDNDGLTDDEERRLGTDPYKADTDGDGYTDKQEVDNGTDPLDPNDPGTCDPGTPGTATPWDAGKIYYEGDLVSYNSKTWKSQWWNQGQQPGANQWGPWKEVTGGDNGCGNPDPDPDPTPGGSWAVNVSYKVGQKVTYGGAEYECIMAHTSNSAWTPSATPSLWRKL